MYASFPVPKGCKRNRTTRNAYDRLFSARLQDDVDSRTMAIGVICSVMELSTTAIPPTADVTETAGVNTPVVGDRYKFRYEPTAGHTISKR